MPIVVMALGIRVDLDRGRAFACCDICIWEGPPKTTVNDAWFNLTAHVRDQPEHQQTIGFGHAWLHDLHRKAEET